MNSNTVLRRALVRGVLNFFHRVKIGLVVVSIPFVEFFKWLYRSKETTNFTYDLHEVNLRYLASLISYITNVEYDQIIKYIEEIKSDSELREHIFNATNESEFSGTADKDVKFGRRVGWYAFARALKPKVIVETGVDKGLGSCVLAAALMKNKKEGFEGFYFGTDINLNAGYLFSGEYSKYGDILYGDSIESLKKLNKKVDLFINDSDHSGEYEAQEYQTINSELSENSIVLGDNSHVTDKLLNFSIETNRSFVYFQEKPINHWYPGAGIGISFRK